MVGVLSLVTQVAYVISTGRLESTLACCHPCMLHLKHTNACLMIAQAQLYCCHSAISACDMRKPSVTLCLNTCLLCGLALNAVPWSPLHPCVLMQAANVDATISRLKHQQAQQEEKKRLAAAAAAAAQNPVRQEHSLDPDFSPRLGSGQLDNPEADDRAVGAAQMAHQMSQVCHAAPSARIVIRVQVQSQVCSSSTLFSSCHPYPIMFFCGVENRHCKIDHSIESVFRCLAQHARQTQHVSDSPAIYCSLLTLFQL